MSETDDRVAIIDLIGRYNRGIDRCDLDTLNGVWAEGATVDYGFNGSDARAWSATTIASLKVNFLRTQHMLGQTVIDLSGDTAQAETYCRAYHELEDANGREEMTFGGRYLDDLIRTPAGWRIARRRYTMDWNSNGASTARWEGPLHGALRVSARYPDDALYQDRGETTWGG